MKWNSKAGHTLVELLFSVIIGVMVMGTVATVLVQIQWSWRDGVAMWYLSQEGRIARERILRGIEGSYGVREGSFNTVFIQPGSSPQVERLEFDDEGIKCRVQTNPGLGMNQRALAGGTGNGTPLPLLQASINDDSLDFVLVNSNRTLRTDITLSLQMGGKTYVHTQRVSTYMLND